MRAGMGVGQPMTDGTEKCDTAHGAMAGGGLHLPMVGSVARQTFTGGMGRWQTFTARWHESHPTKGNPMTLEPTPQLRWIMRDIRGITRTPAEDGRVIIGTESMGAAQVLQQRWRDVNTGFAVWRDVPLEAE